MVALPLRWQGLRRSDQLRDLLATRCIAWRQAWAVTSAPECQLATVQNDGTALARAGERWFDAVVDEGHLYVRLTVSGLASLGGQLLGIEPLGANGLAEGIGRRAVTDLARVLAGTGTMTPRVDMLDSRPDVALAARHGVLSLAWQFGGVRADVHLDAALCDILLPRAPAHAPPLLTRPEAILSESIRLEAVLDLGTARLHEVLALRPGEIIKTSVRIDAPLQACVPGGRRVFSGALHAEHGQRALRCTEIV